MIHSFGRSLAVILTLGIGLCSLTSVCHAVPWRLSYKDGEQIKLQQVSIQSERGRQMFGTFWSLQRTHFPPLPCYPLFLREAGYDVPVYALDSKQGVYLVDDRAVDYEAIYKERERKKQEETLLRSLELNTGLMSLEEFSLLEGGGGGMAMRSYTADELWIELLSVTNDYAYLTLHGTVEYKQYQLLSKTNLAQAVDWLPGQIITGTPGTNQTDFSQEYVVGISNKFFRAHQADNLVSVSPMETGYEPTSVMTNGQAGRVIFYCLSPDDVTIYYRLSGTASNGVDYTNLTGHITIPASVGQTNLYIQPLADALTEGSETVIVSIIETNSYLIDQNARYATVEVIDTPSLIVVYENPQNAVETNGPPGAPAVGGSFYIERYGLSGILPAMGVRYAMTGTASNGVDYVFLNGTLNFAENENHKYLDVSPLDDVLPEGIETVVFTCMPSNTYVIQDGFSNSTMTIADSTTTVAVTVQQDAVEPHPSSLIPKKTGSFLISRSDTRGIFPALTVSYQITGNATPGVDYTNISGAVTFQANQILTNIFIEPYFDDLFEGDELVTLSITHVSDGYVINPSSASAPMILFDNVPTNTFQPIVTGLDFPMGIDYHQPSNSLIVSVGISGGRFVRVFTNTVSTNIVTVVTNWSGVNSLPIEVKLLTAKSTSNGYTNGDTYFSSGNALGWLSADRTRSNLNWCVLTNAVETNALPVGGSINMDVTGIFSNQLIVVTSPADRPLAKKGVWRVNSLGQPTLLTNFVTTHLEGVISLTNDVAKWGPWAGKIITGDENENKIYAIDGIGNRTTFFTTNLFPGGIHTEDFEIIPPNQDLYGCDATGQTIVKLSRTNLTNYVGDLMITDAGEFGSFQVGKLFIVRWDNSTTNFVTRRVLFRYPSSAFGHFEHVTFAPISIPPINP